MDQLHFTPEAIMAYEYQRRRQQQQQHQQHHHHQQQQQHQQQQHQHQHQQYQYYSSAAWPLLYLDAPSPAALPPVSSAALALPPYASAMPVTTAPAQPPLSLAAFHQHQHAQQQSMDATTALLATADWHYHINAANAAAAALTADQGLVHQRQQQQQHQRHMALDAAYANYNPPLHCSPVEGTSPIASTTNSSPVVDVASLAQSIGVDPLSMAVTLPAGPSQTYHDLLALTDLLAAPPELSAAASSTVPVGSPTDSLLEIRSLSSSDNGWTAIDPINHRPSFDSAIPLDAGGAVTAAMGPHVTAASISPPHAFVDPSQTLSFHVRAGSESSVSDGASSALYLSTGSWEDLSYPLPSPDSDFNIDWATVPTAAVGASMMNDPLAVRAIPTPFTATSHAPSTSLSSSPPSSLGLGSLPSLLPIRTNSPVMVEPSAVFGTSPPSASSRSSAGSPTRVRRRRSPPGKGQARSTAAARKQQEQQQQHQQPSRQSPTRASSSNNHQRQHRVSNAGSLSPGRKTDSTGQAVEKRIGRRKGPLRPDQRQQAHEIRKLRACLRCKFLKKTCDKGDPCGGCQPSHARLWQVPCTRIDIKDLAYFMKDWRADSERHVSLAFSVENIKGFSLSERPMFITHGYGYYLPVAAREVYVHDASCFGIDWIEETGSRSASGASSPIYSDDDDSAELATVKGNGKGRQNSKGSGRGSGGGNGSSSSSSSGGGGKKVQSDRRRDVAEFDVMTARFSAGIEGVSRSMVSQYLDRHIDAGFEQFVDSYYTGTPFVTEFLKTAYRYYLRERQPSVRKALKLVLAYNLTVHVTLAKGVAREEQAASKAAPAHATSSGSGNGHGCSCQPDLGGVLGPFGAEHAKHSTDPLSNPDGHSQYYAGQHGHCPGAGRTCYHEDEVVDDEQPLGVINDMRSRYYGQTAAPVMINFQVKCALAETWRALQRDVLEELSTLYSSVYSGDKLRNWPVIFMLVALLLVVWEQMEFDTCFRLPDRDAKRKFCGDMESTPVGVIVGLFSAISQKLPALKDWDSEKHHQILGSNGAVCDALTEVREHVLKHESYLRSRSEAKFDRDDFDCLSNKFLSKLVIRAN